MNTIELIQYLNENTLIEIKAGIDREKFTKIWMVNVEDRIFSRSWNKSEKSWCTESKKQGVGQIKFGNNIVHVKARKVDKNDEINQEINKAYLKKYIQPENIEYAIGITQAEYGDYTMEFILAQNTKK